MPIAVSTGDINNEYTPAPKNAAKTDIMPDTTCSNKVLCAIAWNLKFFIIKAFGTIFMAENKTTTDKIWQIGRSCTVW